MSANIEDHPFGQAPLSMRVCPKCVRGDMVYGSLVTPCPEEIKKQQTWCSKAFCEKCKYEWYVCRTCTNIRQILDSTQKISAHSYKFHRTTHCSLKSSSLVKGITTYKKWKNHAPTANTTIQPKMKQAVASPTTAKASNSISTLESPVTAQLS
jgi:hypothetical protein